MRIATVLCALLLAGCVTADPAPPQELQAAPLAASVPSDLPRVARPLHYRIEIEPDAHALTFAGSSTIMLELYERSDGLTLHAVELEIASARLLPASGGAPVALQPTFDAARQTVRLAAPEILARGAYRLDLVYSGRINNRASGLFALDYPDKRTGDEVRGLFTQFEAPDARRFTPLFDEPSYKATFDLSAIVPGGQMAVGNMPVVREESLPGDRKRVTFATTPKMSSYLLFFAAGDFERLSAAAPGGIEVGVVSPTGTGEQARYALEAMPELIAYYTDYFGLPYPLPKLDNIAAPGRSQFFGAMENWGAILTFERYLLLDPANTDPQTQTYLYTALAHEVAHQWFGNIVTMAWWDDLWLNEGFASWMETKASARFRPEWHPLLDRVEGRETAMGYDGLATTHPVIQPIRTAAETNEAFDAISYSKGEAVIAMLEGYAGEEAWRQGIRSYMARHSYGNTTTDDLWRAVEDTGVTDLTRIAHDFTRQPGVPLVSASAECRDGETTLVLRQGEFSRDRAEEVSARPQRWRVPLLIKAGAAEPRRLVLDGSATVQLPGCGAVIVNGGQLGYFRTLYSPAMASALTRALPQLEAIEQLGLLQDAFALAEANYQPLPPAMDLLGAIPGAANPRVAEGALERWAAVYGVASAADRPHVAARVRARWHPRLEQLGYEPRAGEGLPDTRLRAALLGTLGKLGDETVIGEARCRFAALAQDRLALDGPLKSTWLAIAARNTDAAGWTALAGLAQTSPTSVERQSYFELLGRAADRTLAQRALELALTGEAGTASAAILEAVALEHPDLAFDFAMAHRAGVDALLDAGGRTGFIAGLAATSRDPAMIGKLEAFRARLASDERLPVDRQIAALRDRLNREPRLSEQVSAWLAADRAR